MDKAKELLREASPLAAEALIEALEATQYVKVGADDWDDKPDFKTRFAAAVEILDRVFGKPSQAGQETGGATEVPVDLAARIAALGSRHAPYKEGK